MRAEPLPWLIFGTGTMSDLTLAALQRAGISTIIAGRNQDATAQLGRLYHTETRHFPDRRGVYSPLLDNISGVINTAGPYVHTAGPLMRDCLRSGVHYIDYSNELPTHIASWSLKSAAEEAEIAIVPGAGFGTVASVMLGEHLCRQITDPTDLAVVLIRRRHSGSSPAVQASSRSILGADPACINGGALCYQGRNTPWARTVSWVAGRPTGIPLGNGDLLALSKSLQLQNITTYVGISTPAWVTNVALPLIRQRARRAPRRNFEMGAFQAKATSKSAEAGRSPARIWASIRNRHGQSAAAYLETPSGSIFAARAALTIVQGLEARSHTGTFSARQLADVQLLMASTQTEIVNVPGTLQ